MFVFVFKSMAAVPSSSLPSPSVLPLSLVVVNVLALLSVVVVLVVVASVVVVVSFVDRWRLAPLCLLEVLAAAEISAPL